MRFYTVALFFFVFNLLMGLVATTYGTGATSADWTISSDQKNYKYQGTDAMAATNGATFGDVIRMGGMFLATMGAATAVPGYYLGQILNHAGVSILINIAISGAFTVSIWMIYLAAGIQMFSNRGWKFIE